MTLAGLGAIGRRAMRYVAIARWLASIARELAPRQLIAVPVLSVVAITLQIGAIVLATQFIARFQSGAAASAGIRSAQLGQPVVQAVLIGLLLALAGTAHYAASRMSLVAYQEVSVGLTHKILAGLQSLPGPFEKWRLVQRIGRRGLLKVLSVDVDKCGLATRIVLANTINVFFLLAGLAFFLLASPALFGGLLVIALVGASIAYPMSLKAVRSATALDESQRQRRDMIATGLDASLSLKRPADTTSRMRELQETERGFVRLLTDRFAVIDGSRFAMSLLFALVVGLLLVLVALDSDHLLFDYSRLLILFFAFRFTYQGLQGLMIASATINRFLPDLGRIADLLAELDRRRTAAAGSATAEAAPVLADKRASIAWNNDCGSGSLDAGRLHLIVEPPGIKPELVFRLLDFVDRDRPRLARQIVDGTVAPPDRAAAEASAGRAAAPVWIEEALALARAPSDDLAPMRALLAAIDETARRGAPILAIADPLLLSLPDEAIARLIVQFPDRLLIATVPWVAEIGPGLAAGWVLVSNGQRIAFASEARTMTETDWDTARRIYAMAAGNDASGRPQDDDELDIEG